MLDTFLKSPLVYHEKEVIEASLNRDGLIQRQQSVDADKVAFFYKTLPHYFKILAEEKLGEYSQLLIMKDLVAKFKKNKDDDPDAALTGPLGDNPKGEKKRLRLLKFLRQFKQFRKEVPLALDDYYLKYDDILDKLIKNTRSIRKLIRFKKYSKDDLAKLKEIINNFKETLSFFAKFDAENDHNFFFRPGFVDFEKAGKLMNGALSFYNHKSLQNKDLGPLFLTGLSIPAPRQPTKIYGFQKHTKTTMAA